MTMGRANKIMRKIINTFNRLRLRNHDFSVIASNCNGCLILHDLGQPFNSPFVNLWVPPADFIRYLQNPDHYRQCDMHFVQEEGISFPVGVLDDVRLYFVHYKTPEEARQKWMERTKRLKMDNLFIMFTDRDGCTMDDLRAFDALPYPNKVVFTHVPRPEIKSAFYIRGFENEGQVGEMYSYMHRRTGLKYYDLFPYVKWFNRGRPAKR